MTLRLLRMLPAAAVAFGLTGCAADATPPEQTGPTDAEYDEIAAAVGPLVTSGESGEVSVLLQTTAVARGTTPSWMEGKTSGLFQGQHSGITYDYDVRCEGETGSGIPCGQTAVSATAYASWLGAIDLDWFDASIDFTGEWRLTELQGSEAILIGGAEADVMTHYTHADGAKRHFWMHYASDYDVLRIDTVSGRPVAGTAHYELDVRRTTGLDVEGAEDRYQLEAELVWNRSDEAQLILDGTRFYRLNVHTGQTWLDPQVHHEPR